MRPAIPVRRKFQIVNTYPDLDSARIIARCNPTRGLFMLTIQDSFDATRPRRWSILIEGGTQYTGFDSKYFLITNSGENVASYTATVEGYEYDLTDAFGNTYHLIFNGALNFNPTIERTAGAALTGPIQIQTLLFPFDVPN